MYTRRVQKTGGSTYIVSLPSVWAEKNGITKGSELTIEENDDRLILSLGKKKKEVVRKVLISGDVDGEMFLRTLISLYISNFDTLIIESSRYLSKEIRETARRFSKLVMGVEIFEESSSNIILQNVLDSDSFPLEKAIRRMATNVSLMLQDAIKGIIESDNDLLDSVIQRDDEVDRYHLYVFRETNGKGAAAGTVFLLIFSRILERIADHAVSASRSWRDYSPGPATKGLADFFMMSQKAFEDSLKALYSPDHLKLNEIIGRKEAIISAKRKLIEEAKKGDLVIVTSLVEEITRIGLYSTDIAELAMDRTAAGQEEISIGD
ncbi:MAG: PhoU domain-containing protein [Thermoplasmataceae archaeon]